MVLLKIAMLILWLVIVPLFMGLCVQMILPRSKKTIIITFICGYLLSFSIFEIVAIGCMLKIHYGAFRYCVRYFAIITLIVAALGCILTIKRVKKEIATGKSRQIFDERRTKRLQKYILMAFPGDEYAEPEALISPRTDARVTRFQYTKESIFFWGLFAAIVLFQLFMALFMAPFDGDDAYYVVESLLAQQADVMNTILPYTGSSTSLDIRHAMAVFTMWEAFIARITGIHATIVAHSVMPLILIPIVYMVYLEIGRILVGAKQELLPVYMIFISLIQMFGNTSIYTVETFFMMRTWQGKAMVANLMLPFVLWIFLWMFDDCRKPGFLWKEETGGGRRIIRNSTWVLLFMVNMAAGIMSSMGIFFCGALIGLLSLLLMIYTRNLKIVIKVFLSMIPSIVYLMVYLSVWMP